jgi:hypothetical protein
MSEDRSRPVRRGHEEATVTTVRTIDAEAAVDYRPPPSAGWLAFASTMLAIGGVFKIFDAFWAFKYDDDVSDQLQTILFERDLKSWGWVWLTMGVLLLIAAACVVTGSQWARWVGILAAGAGAIVFLPWIYYQPLWTVLSVSLMILTIYALAAYGGRRDSWA